MFIMLTVSTAVHCNSANALHSVLQHGFQIWLMYGAVDKRLDEWVTFEKVSEYDGLQAAQQPLLSHTSSGLA